MNSSESQISIKDLINSRWDNLIAMPVQDNRRILLDIIFTMDSKQIGITGKAIDLADGSEAYILDLYHHHASGWWSPLANDNWVPRDLKLELLAKDSKCLLFPPRQVRYYIDKVMSTSTAHIRELELCSGIEFLKHSDGEIVRIVIAASRNYPCAIEFSDEPKTCDELLSGLVEVRYES